MIRSSQGRESIRIKPNDRLDVLEGITISFAATSHLAGQAWSSL